MFSLIIVIMIIVKAAANLTQLGARCLILFRVFLDSKPFNFHDNPWHGCCMGDLTESNSDSL